MMEYSNEISSILYSSAAIIFTIHYSLFTIHYSLFTIHYTRVIISIYLINYLKLLLEISGNKSVANVFEYYLRFLPNEFYDSSLCKRLQYVGQKVAH